MKKYYLVLFLFFPVVLPAQKNEKMQISEKILFTDSLFWAGYNNCTLPVLQQLVATDVEFYHDKGGITLGATNLKESIQKNICNNKEGKIRREAMTGKSNLFLMQDNGNVYAAIISGDHLFYITPNGAKEYLTGKAKFMSFWKLYQNNWQLYRVFSYEHQPVSK